VAFGEKGLECRLRRCTGLYDNDCSLKWWDNKKLIM